jgi:hypothetical protein
MEDEEQEIWAWADFNRNVDLCYCCGQELIRSGTKWSVWFCGECKGRVVALNMAMSKTVIPIGRHSLMSGVGLRAVGGVCDEKVGDFIKDLGNFFANTDTVSKWREHIVLKNLRNLDCETDPPVIEYLARVRILSKKSEIFREMCEFVRKRCGSESGCGKSGECGREDHGRDNAEKSP